MKLRIRGNIAWIEDTPPPSVHHFSPRLVQRGAEEGWLSLMQGKIVLHGPKHDVSYRIKKGPGAYCCNCGEKIGAGPSIDPRVCSQRIKHVEACCGKAAHTVDAQYPAGYRCDNYYDCKLEV